MGYCYVAHVQIKYSLVYLQDLILTLVAMFTYYFMPAKVGIKSCRYATENSL